MESVAKLSAAERQQLFQETAARQLISPAIVEKDFWVCWVLGRLFTTDGIRNSILFKGGTTLSKVFGLVQRFSEDIDLVLDWNKVALEDPRLERTKTKQDQFNKNTIDRSREYLRSVMLPAVRTALGDMVSAEIQPATPDVIDIRYPAAFAEAYLRPEIRLEIGPLAAWMPNSSYTITPYAAQAFPQLFKAPEVQVQAIKAERTFWEKATILHQEAHREEDKPLPLRYSRHYYDLMRMALSPVKDSALADGELLQQVVDFKQKYYPCKWARYDLAVHGTLCLLPPAQAIASLKKDYTQMQIMIFGEIPSFDEIMDVLASLATEINTPRN